MFVKKLVEKASKKPGGNTDGLKSSDVEPRLLFHYGIPSGAALFAYQPTQNILAIATRDGRIKLFGRDNTQAMLQSPEAVPTKFIQFIYNKGFLLNVTSKNQIEVWDVDKKKLCHVHILKENITSFMVMQLSPYMYIGDSTGNVSIFKFDQESCNISQMNYTIPVSAARGNTNDASADHIPVVHLLPHPAAESKRVLIVFSDGLITLWDIWGSRSIFSTGGSFLQSQYHETKKVTSACWACPHGSKVAVGYSNGEIFIWGIPTTQNLIVESSNNSTQSTPLSKLNLGYKVDKVPITSLKWLHADGKASRLYVMGASDSTSTNMVQVVLLNEHLETRTIKLPLHISEPCIDMEIMACNCEQSKNKEDSFLLLGKSGRIHAYDDFLIEKYLLQSQTKSSLSLPKEVSVKMPFIESTITVAKFITHDSFSWDVEDEDYLYWAKNSPSLFSFDAKPKDGTRFHFSGFAKVKHLYITGHGDGAVNFWDLSSQFLIPILSLKQQSEDDFSASGTPLTALHFDENSMLLITGDQSGVVRMYKFKPEPCATDSSFISFQGSSKRGNSIIQSVKLQKVNGSVIFINICHSSGHLAVGTDHGYVYLVDMEGPNLLYQQHISSEISTGIISLQFETCKLHGFEKNVLLVATKDSSVLALESDTGNFLSTSTVHPKKPSRALFMQIWDGQNMLSPRSNRDPMAEDSPKQSFVLICSEKAVYLYSLNHVVQGVKKVHYKKKFNSSSCCWASTFFSASDVGLVLVFSNGKIEIRSLPELSLLKESSLKGFAFSASKLNSSNDSTICCSQSGELVMARGDQELLVMSVLLHKENFRILDSVSQVYSKDVVLSQGELKNGSPVQKEKKKGLFSCVIKDIKGSKPKQVFEVETEDTKESIAELSTIFSTTNFACDTENKESLTMDDDGSDLDIDDIDLDDIGDKPKEQQNMLAGLNKQKLANKFLAFKGKIKQMKGKNEKNISKEEEAKDEKAGHVDNIKKKYGYSLSGETSAAKVAESKLLENLSKLQGINLRATEMNDTAKSFSSMAKEVLRIAEKDKGNS